PRQVVRTTCRGFLFPSQPPDKESPHQSTHVVMTPHHITPYPLLEEENATNYVQVCPGQGKRTRRRMSETLASMEDHYEPQIYEIRLKGYLDDKWSDWFGGLTITLEADGNTLLTGPVVDQAALHGLLKKVRDVGLPLLSVNSVGLDAEELRET
ncbi:MAG: hypothetical protein MUO29_12965, partial [Desulfobacterales bacterium]|nr:hypothetical protein [Desulfobacterales bacterium]